MKTPDLKKGDFSTPGELEGKISEGSRSWMFFQQTNM